MQHNATHTKRKLDDWWLAIVGDLERNIRLHTQAIQRTITSNLCHELGYTRNTICKGIQSNTQVGDSL
jgi:hypothetical protein